MRALVSACVVGAACTVPVVTRAQGAARTADRPTAARSDGPDLSGSWVLNKAKSDFGLLPVPANDTSTYTRDGAVYRVVETSASDSGAMHITYSWPAGAGEATSDLPDEEASVQTRVTLHGDTALFVSQLKHKGRTIEIESGREYLSADRKVRTREFDLQSLANPDADTQHILAVFDKQPG